MTQLRYTPKRTAFSLLQATAQAWQPMQRRRSTTTPHLIQAILNRLLAL